MIIPFGEYLPDKAPQNNPGLTVAKNCVPFLDYYDQINGLQPYGNALTNTCRGAISCRNKSGTVYSYAGDSSKLYRLASGVWVDATNTTSGTYSVAVTDNWEFAQWGDYALATNGQTVLQEITLGASNFANTVGSPPIAKHIDVVRDFVVLGNCLDYSSGASVPNRLHWSGFNNKDTWTPAPSSTQCDFQDLNASYGFIQRVIGGEIGVVFQERAITRMLYVGVPLIWQFDTVETNKGTPAPGSVVKVGGTIFYLGDDDFYAFNGASSQNIGAERIYKTFLADLNSAYLNRVKAVADPYNTLVYWAYPSVNSDNGTPDKIIVFNWVANKWSGPIELNVEWMFTFLSEGYTLDSLDTIGTNIDLFTDSFDSKVWMGGSPNIAVFNTAHRMAMFAGNPLRAVFETGDRQLTPMKRTLVSLTRPLIEGESASSSVAISGRDTSKEVATFSQDVSTNSYGECGMFKDARYHRFRVTVAGGFSHASGIEIEGGPGGRY